MRQEIAMVQHVDPDLTVGNNLRFNRLLDYLARRDGSDDDPSSFEIILSRFPREFESVLEPVHNPFLLE